VCHGNNKGGLLRLAKEKWSHLFYFFIDSEKSFITLTSGYPVMTFLNKIPGNTNITMMRQGFWLFAHEFGHNVQFLTGHCLSSN